MVRVFFFKDFIYLREREHTQTHRHTHTHTIGGGRCAEGEGGADSLLSRGPD